jgi:hypothetical protein
VGDGVGLGFGVGVGDGVGLGFGVGEGVGVGLGFGAGVGDGVGVGLGDEDAEIEEVAPQPAIANTKMMEMTGKRERERRLYCTKWGTPTARLLAQFL